MSFELGYEAMTQVQKTGLEIYALDLREFSIGPPSDATSSGTMVCATARSALRTS